MNFGIIHETRLDEKRVCLTPNAAKSLIKLGHQVFVETGAGNASGFVDQQFTDAGAQVVFNPEEIYGRSDILLKILPLTEDSVVELREGQTVIAFHHLSTATSALFHQLVDKGINTLGMELIEEAKGYRPMLTIMSELAGQMAPIIAGTYLGLATTSKGLTLGAVPGVAPASVVIIGGGTVGHSAARAFLGLGAQVHILDTNIEQLRRVRQSFGDRVTTLFADQANLEKALGFADVVLSAVLVRGELTTQFISRDMIRQMKDLAVFIDYSVDEGGTSETTRPTHLADPIYIEEGVIHYCVPNINAGVSRSASIALSNVLAAYLEKIGRLGIKEAIAVDDALRRGLYTFAGKSMQPRLSERYGVDGR